MSAPLRLHLGFVPSYLFPVAEADGLGQSSYGIETQFCLNFGCVGIVIMILKGADNGKIIPKPELHHERSGNSAKCSQSSPL